MKKPDYILKKDEIHHEDLFRGHRHRRQGTRHRHRDIHHRHPDILQPHPRPHHCRHQDIPRRRRFEVCHEKIHQDFHFQQIWI